MTDPGRGMTADPATETLFMPRKPAGWCDYVPLAPPLVEADERLMRAVSGTVWLQFVRRMQVPRAAARCKPCGMGEPRQRSR